MAAMPNLRWTLALLAIAALAEPARANFFCTPVGDLDWRAAKPLLTTSPDYGTDQFGTIGFWIDTDTKEYGERLDRGQAGITLEAVLDVINPGTPLGEQGTQDFIAVDRVSGLFVRISPWTDPMPFIRIGPDSGLLVGTCDLGGE
jgi:hypothetical protein